MSKRLSSGKLYLFGAFFVVLAGVLLTMYSSYNSYRSQRSFLEQRVAGLASALPKDVIKRLGAEEEDLGTRDYQTIKTSLQDIAESNPDIRFIYITKERESTVYFVADSEPAGSEDESPPGQSYDEVDEKYQDAHKEILSTVIGPTSDRWGTWISGVATITENNKPIAVLGMDIPANAYIQNVVVSGVIVLVPSALIAVVFLFASAEARRKDKELLERLTLLTLVTNSVRTPLEGIKWASHQLLERQTTANDQESIKLATELSSSVDKVVQSVEDIVSLAKNSSQKDRVVLADRVDVVALVIDIIDRFKLNMTTKKISILLGDTWPASYVVDSNLESLSRLITALIVRSIDKTEAGGTVQLRFGIDQNVWTVEVSLSGSRMEGPVDGDESKATLTLLTTRLKGRLLLNQLPGGEQVTLAFRLSGNELKR